MFPEPRDQAKAIGVYGFVASAGGSLGLLAGGVLTDLINWHWIFFVNVPIGLATGLLAVRLVESRPGIGLAEGADVPGAVLVTAGLMLAVYTILGVEEHGWTSAQTLILAAVSVGLVAAFVVRQARIEKPLMPLRLFHSRNVSGANIVMALLVVGMFGIFFLGALYMQLVLGYEPLEVGLAFLPGSLLMGVLSLGFTDKLNMRFGPRNVLIAGLCLLLVAMLLFTRTPVDGNYLDRPVPDADPLRRRRGRGLPRPDDARDVGCHAERRRARVRPREHDRPGGRRGRPRAAGHALHRAHAEPARGGRVDGGRAERRLPPRLPDRGGGRRWRRSWRP